MSYEQALNVPNPLPWNKGRLIGQKRPLKPKEVWAIRVRLELVGNKRDLALFDLAIDSKLRACDLVRLKINDVQVGGRTRERATIIQKKTGRPVQFEITESTRRILDEWVRQSVQASGEYLFPSRTKRQSHISTRQYARSVHKWVNSAGLVQPTALIRCGEPRPPKFIAKPETCGLFNSCSGIRSLKARSDTSE